MRQIKVLLEEDSKPDPLAGRFPTRFQQDEAVMAGFSQPTQIAGACVLLGDRATADIHVEVSALRPNGHMQHDVARAGKIEWWSQISRREHGYCANVSISCTAIL